MYEYIYGDKIMQSTLERGEDLFLKDQWKREYHFKIASFTVPTGLASEAIEVKDDNSHGYMFNILSDFDTETFTNITNKTRRHKRLLTFFVLTLQN